MKTTFALTALLMWSASGFAQVEQDDMYFNKKDRIKAVKEASASETAMDEALAKGEKPIRFDYTINKNSGSIDNSATSPRETNPEYIARSQSEMLAGEEESYFIENYQYATQKQLSTFSDSLNNWGNAPLYSNNYYSPSIGGWNSPYYSPYNDPFLTGYSTNPWCNTGFQSGLSAAFSFNWGSNYGYGWGYPSIGMNFYYGNSMANLYWNGAHWGLGYSYGGYGYGGYYPGYYPGGMGYSIVEAKGPVYGKRGSRGKDVINPARYATSNSNRVVSSRNNNLTGGSSTTRTSSRSSSSEYYTPQWRRVTQQASPASTTQNRVSSATSDFFQNRSGSNQRSSSSFSSPSNRSSFSAPSRSSSGGSSGSRSSRSRGN